MGALESRNFPSAPEEAYLKILERIEASGEQSRKLAFRTISWLYHCKRLLTYLEMREAICDIPFLTEAELERYGLRRYPSILEITRCCKSSVVYDESLEVFRFVHETFKSFLTKALNASESSIAKRHIWSNVFTARTCIKFLDYFDKGAIGTFGFGGYIQRYWSSHAKGEAESNDDVQGAILNCILKKTRSDPATSLDRILHRTPEFAIATGRNETLIHILAREGLAKLCETVLGKRYPPTLVS